MPKNIIYKLLEQLQIPSNGILMVHSAFKPLALDGYKADQVLDALIDYMHLGTLIMPTMSWRFVNLQNPIFNEITTACNTGILAEKFRTIYATHRSIHPTHSACALGNLAAELTAKHHLSHTPCDGLSPYGMLAQHSNAHIMMLGVGIDCCTMLHSAEEAVAPDIYVKDQTDIETYKCINRDNNLLEVAVRKHKFLPRNYWVIQDKLAQLNKLQLAKLDNSVALAFNVADIYDLTCSMLKQDQMALLAKPGQRYRMM